MISGRDINGQKLYLRYVNLTFEVLPLLRTDKTGDYIKVVWFVLTMYYLWGMYYQLTD